MNKNASSASKSNHNELSAAEFQRNLYNWFENQGLLDELRVHLRRQMVTALRNTSLGPSSSKHSKRTISPKIHAINLLVAEFLLQQEHHYTLSVFTSEIPLLRNMPEFTLSGTGISDRSNSHSEHTPRFHHQDVRDILESLGLSLNAEVGNRIYHQYRDSSESLALLTCILQNASFISDTQSHRHDDVVPRTSGTRLPTRGSKSDINIKKMESSDKESRSTKKLAELYNAEMQEVLYQSQMKSLHIKQLQEEIRRFQDTEVQRVRKEEEVKFQKELVDREARIQADICRREEEINRKLEEAEDRLERQRQSLDNELQMKRQHLSDLAVQLKEQHLDADQKLQEVEKHAEELKQQEKKIKEIKEKDALQLAERTSELDVRQQQLQQEFDRLNAEREAMNYAQHELEDTRIQLAEASRSLARSRSEVSFLCELQQQCANLHLELDVTRNKLDNLTELHHQKSSHSKVSVHHHRSVETVDKGLQTVIALPADELPLILPERLPSQDRTMELEVIQPQQQLQQQHHQYIVDLLRQVQQENRELRGHTQQQRLRIDELTSHAAELANQLEDAHTAITLLSNRPTPEPGPSDPRISATLFHPGSGTITVPPIRAPSPPPPAPPLPPQDPFISSRAVQQSRQMGAGEVSYISPPIAAQTPSPIPTSSSRSNLYHRREWRKKPPRRLMVHSTTSSDETSPTEEILQEARRRLRRLEAESEAVDRSYQDFRIRHAESLAATASLLFHPIVPSTHQLLSSNLGYGSSITPSQPLYSSATGSSYRTQTPVYFRSMNFQDTSFPRHTETLFNSSLPRNTFISPIVHTHRIPSTVQFSVGASTQSQYDFPPRLRTPGSVDSTITAFSNRTAMQSHSRAINNTRLTPDTFVITSIAPQTNFMSRIQHQSSTRSNLHFTRAQQLMDDTDSRYRRDSLSQTNLMEPHIPSSLEPHQNEARNVTFGSPLTTVTVYNGPQVSSSIECSTNRSVTQEELNGETASNIPINRDIVMQESSATTPTAIGTVQSHSPTKSTVSITQSLLANEAWEDPLIKEIGLPACLVDSSSSAHDDDWNSSQARTQYSGMEFLENKDKYNITRRLSSDNIWKLQHKPSLPSSLIPSLASESDMKGTKLSSKNSSEATPLKEYKNIESTSVQFETLLAIGNEAKSQTSVTGALSSRETIPPESFVSNETATAIGSGTSESDLHAILSSSIMSGTTFSSSIKDPSSKSTSADGESFIPILKERNEKLLNKQRPDTNIEIPTHDDEVPSEISESVTQTTVKNREIKLNLIGTSKNESIVQTIRINMAETIKQATREENMLECDLGSAQNSLAALLLLKDKPPMDACLTKTYDQTNEAEEKLDSNLTNINNQDIAQKLTEQQTNFQGKNHSGSDLEATSQDSYGKEINSSDNGKKFNVFMLSKSRDESELSIAEGTDQDISVGKESKKDDSSNDDFW